MFRRFANSAVRGVRMIPRLSVSVQSGASILSRSTTPALRAVRAESAIRSSLQSGSSVLAAIRRRWVSTQTVAPAAPNTNTSNSATAAAAAADAATGSQSNTAKAANTTDAAGAGGGDSGSVSDSGARQKKRGHRKAQDVPSTTADKTGGAVPQTIIPPLPPGSLPPATAEELPAAEMEGPFRCVAYEVGEAFNLERMEHALQTAQALASQSTPSLTLTTFQNVLLATYSPPSAPAPESGEGAIKKVFFLAEGEVVFWGTSAAEEREWLSFARPFAADAVTDITQMFTEDMPYYIGKDPHTTTRVHADSIILNGRDDDKSRTRQQLAFSMSIARSLQLDSVEEELEEFLEILEPLPIDLARNKLPPKSMWSKIVSKQLALRGRLNLHSALLEIPELYWDKPRYEEFYKSMEKNLDIPNRIAILNKRMDYTEHVTEVVRSELDSNRSHFAETLIIVLISLEIVAHLAEKWEWWRQFRWESLFQPKPKHYQSTKPPRDRHTPTAASVKFAEEQKAKAAAAQVAAVQATAAKH